MNHQATWPFPSAMLPHNKVCDGSALLAHHHQQLAAAAYFQQQQRHQQQQVQRLHAQQEQLKLLLAAKYRADASFSNTHGGHDQALGHQQQQQHKEEENHQKEGPECISIYIDPAPDNCPALGAPVPESPAAATAATTTTIQSVNAAPRIDPMLQAPSIAHISEYPRIPRTLDHYEDELRAYHGNGGLAYDTSNYRVDPQQVALEAKKKRNFVRWYSSYKKLQAWYSEHGHSEVTITRDRSLYNWCAIQKRKRMDSRLGRFKVDLLGKLNFDFRVTGRTPWDEHFEQLKVWYRENRPAEVGINDDKSLYLWCCNQRYAHRNSTLSPFHVKLLNKVGFDFEITQRHMPSWDLRPTTDVCPTGREEVEQKSTGALTG